MGCLTIRVRRGGFSGTVALNIWLYIAIPKTFFPEQDTGVLMGGIQADRYISFQPARQTAGFYYEKLSSRRSGGE